MFSLFKKKTAKSATIFTVQPFWCSFINFDQLVRGIDNVHIDVHFSPHFTELCTRLTYELLDERSSDRRRSTDKPSEGLRTKLETLNANYASMLIAAVHRAKKGKRIDSVQLFQIAVIKFLLATVRTQADQILYELRKASLKASLKNLNLSERIGWINQNKNGLLYRVTSELFDQIHWVESGNIGVLRETLLGITWTLPEKMLSNPLLQSPDTQDHGVLMKHYVLLSQDPDSNYGFERLDALIDQLLEEMANTCCIQIDPSLEKECANNPFIDEGRVTEVHFSWKDVPANMNVLFNIEETLHALKDEPPDQHATLKAKLQFQRQTNKILEQGLHQAQVILPLLAAYETPRLYVHYAKLLKPYLLFQALCDDISLLEVKLKLHLQLKIRPLRRPGDKPLYINELKNAKKRVAKLARHPSSKILMRFITDFITYRRDLKYHRLMLEAMEPINLMTDETQVQSSRINDTLYEFLEENEDKAPPKPIRSHVILKAELRGTTTITDALCQQGLNPATHFSRYFFNPIRQYFENFGAEKVVIEENAVILCLLEHEDQIDDWFATARACGLAKYLLQVLNEHNKFNQAANLPPLELGIGICYSPEPPKFLSDGEQKIMISHAINAANHLSSCSQKLRRKYVPSQFTQVMVFQHPTNDTRIFRYNVNGIELHPAAFKKLQSEMALRTFKIRLPGEEQHMRFYLGYYPDTKGNTHELVICEGQILLWEENTADYLLTDNLFYEIVTNPTILSAIKKREEVS